MPFLATILRPAALFLLLGLPACGTSDRATVTFQVFSEAPLPDTAVVYLAGDGGPLGYWEPDAVPLERQPDGSWAKTLQFDRGATVTYKFTRGTWLTEAVAADGAVPENHRLDILNDTTLIYRVANWKDAVHKVEGGITGHVAYHRGLEGEGIRPRDVIVWLPPSYEAASEKRYPVLYMHDGQNIVDPRTSYTQIDWQVDETADSLSRKGQMEEILIVGIYNTEDRTVEYADTDLGRAYLRFLVDDLKPLIDRTYRTRPEAAHTGVMGSSMGGLISFLAAWYHPDVFAKAACLSPVFRAPLIRRARTADWERGDLRLYIDNGGDGLDDQLQPGVESMLAALKSRGFEENRDLMYFRAPTAPHSERAWAARVWRPLLFLFGTDRAPQ